MPQMGEDPDGMLQTEEESSDPVQKEPRPSTSLATKTLTLETTRGIISKSKKGKEKEPHLFSHVPHLKMAQAYEETLSESLTHCHHPWSPDDDGDPLTGFGAEEGILPGLNFSRTMPFCDMVIC